MPVTPEVLNRNNILLDSGSQQTFLLVSSFSRENNQCRN